MPTTPTYPGVYIQEVESDVRTIAPVDTATTAFIGRALRGPVDKPVVINSYADFQRIFGGLWLESSLGYAVNQFFLNGGSKAVVVRLYHAPDDDKARAKIEIKNLPLEAANPGAWGNNLRVRITRPNEEIEKQLEKKYDVPEKSLFDLTVYDTKSGVTENITDLTVADGPRRVDRALANESQLIALAGKLSAKPTRPDAHPEPKANKSAWDDEEAHTAAKAESGSDGKDLTDEDFTGNEADKKGIYALEHTDIFNLLVIPPYKADDVGKVLPSAAAYCEKRRAMLLVDPPSTWNDKNQAKSGFPTDFPGPLGNNAAIFFPRIKANNPLRDNHVEEFAPCGAIAGIFARTDATRGVWKAPAGLDATLRGVVGLTVPLTDAENGELNPLGINCLRQMPAAGYVVWGARTTVGDDRLASQWKYVPVRRTALYIEESLYRGTQWAVFEPNDEPLWSQLRLNIRVFMHGLFRQGAFKGQSPKDAYFVKCDGTTTTQADIDRGIVNIIVGFAPLKPAEFVVLYIQQIAGQLNV